MSENENSSRTIIQRLSKLVNMTFLFDINLLLNLVFKELSNKMFLVLI